MALQMERWAGSKLGEKAYFLMVCVDPAAERTARKFVSEYDLKHVIVGFCGAQNEYPPFPGQLGCGGLVLFSPGGRIAVPKTPSYNQIGLKAWFTADCAIATLCDEDDEGDDEEDVKHRLYRNMNELRLDLQNGGVGVIAAKEEAQSKNPTSTSVIEKEKKKALGSVPRVGHDLMDEEHEHCAALFQQLEREPSVEVFEALVREMQEHFEHEEQLLKQTGFGSASPAGLSPLITHSQDHKRIITTANAMLEAARAAARVKGKGGDFASVLRGGAKELAELFVAHATQHDSRYVEYLATF
ncbi:hypothetical protein TrLO_g6706 [Triparma laevis f. longispina]|uniref:Hemerythrin-like domain-containing protein n=1 Tax=Triparma laevis f. longispina TaxID=1714387 RepID=A0A9W7CD21_9STRA|nr:hypothetical protein TrLO_g6706 [Triparma laevis f. longispina]